MFEALKRLLKSEDNKPVTVTALLLRDDCSRLLGHFADKELNDCRYLIVVWEDAGGTVKVSTSANCDCLQAVGLLTVANSLVVGNNNAK